MSKVTRSALQDKRSPRSCEDETFGGEVELEISKCDEAVLTLGALGLGRHRTKSPRTVKKNSNETSTQYWGFRVSPNQGGGRRPCVSERDHSEDRWLTCSSMRTRNCAWAEEQKGAGNHMGCKGKPDLFTQR